MSFVYVLLKSVNLNHSTMATANNCVTDSTRPRDVSDGQVARGGNFSRTHMEPDICRSLAVSSSEPSIYDKNDDINSRKGALTTKEQLLQSTTINTTQQVTPVVRQKTHQPPGELQQSSNILTAPSRTEINSSPSHQTLNVRPQPAGLPLACFLVEITVKFLCSYCWRVLLNPKQSPCGHRFCHSCAEEMFREVDEDEAVECQVCKGEGADIELRKIYKTQLFPDNAIKRELWLLPVKCLFEECEWTGVYKALEEHTVHCKHGKRCEVCQKLVSVHKYYSHYFSQHGVFGRKGKCYFGCDNEVAETDMEEHVKNFHYAHFKAIFTFLAELEARIGALTTSASPNTTAIDNILMLERKINDLSKQILDMEKATDQGTTNLASATTASMSNGNGNSREIVQINTKLSATDETLTLHEGVIAVLSKEIEKLVQQTEALERQRHLGKDLLNTIDGKLKMLERSLAVKDGTIVELEQRVRANEFTSYDGVFLWKITDVSRKRHDAVSGRATNIYSPYFFTSRTGYKMCARLYPNGDGMGKGSHLSLFFVLMRGNFDGLLRWPFRQKVTLMLIDQNNRDHVIDAFRPDPTSSSFKRPTSEMNIASGCPMFAPLSVLDSQTQAYVKDDTCFIKIIVNCDDLV